MNYTSNHFYDTTCRYQLIFYANFVSYELPTSPCIFRMWPFTAEVILLQAKGSIDKWGMKETWNEQSTTFELENLPNKERKDAEWLKEEDGERTMIISRTF